MFRYMRARRRIRLLEGQLGFVLSVLVVLGFDLADFID